MMLSFSKPFLFIFVTVKTGGNLHTNLPSVSLLDDAHDLFSDLFYFLLEAGEPLAHDFSVELVTILQVIFFFDFVWESAR